MRERQAAAAVARAAETERRQAQQEARLAHTAALKGAVEARNNDREERAYQRRVGPQRGLNEEQHGACFGTSGNNALVAAVGGGRGTAPGATGAVFGSARSARSGLFGSGATSARQPQQANERKRNASTLAFNDF